MVLLLVLILVVALIKFWYLALGGLVLGLAGVLLRRLREAQAREDRDRLRHARARQEIDEIAFATAQAMITAARERS
jgi:hypothetical protein